MRSRGDIIRKACKKTNMSYEFVAFVLDTLVDEIKSAMIQGDGVYIKEFAKFYVDEKPERLQRNPKTDEVELYPPTKMAKCKFSEKLKQQVKGEREHEDGIL